MYKWGLRVARLVALTLIALPEPITTVIGAGILVGIGLITKKRDNQMLKRFAGWLAYLSQMRLEQGVAIKYHLKAPVEHYVFDTGFEMRSSQKMEHPKANLSQLSRGCQAGGNSQPLNQHEATRCTMPMPSPCRGDKSGSYFEVRAVPSTIADAYRPPQKVEHHLINMARLRALYKEDGKPGLDFRNPWRPTPPVASQTTQHHMVNVGTLVRRYKMVT